MKNKTMAEWADIGRNLIQKELISLILMFRKDLRKLGSRGNGGHWLRNRKCLVMRLNIRYVHTGDGFPTCQAPRPASLFTLVHTLLTDRRLVRSKVSLRNVINCHLCSIRPSPRKKRSVHFPVLLLLAPLTSLPIRYLSSLHTGFSAYSKDLFIRLQS